MPLNEWPRVLTVAGEAQSGKSHALIAIANASLAHGPVIYLVAHPEYRGVRHLLRDAGLRPDVRVVTTLDRGRRPKTVVVDEAQLLSTAARESLIALCRALGVLFLLLAQTEA